jgi:glycosyltransferase involved in cell wall biosynthesis
MDQPGPDYSIVIPAYNEEALLPGTLAALAEAMGAVAPSGEVVVCDNNSTDRTAEIARAAGATVVSEPKNQISRARNAGARAARGRHLVFVDADTVVPPALLARALGALGSGRVVGGGAAVAMDVPPTGVAAVLLSSWNALSRRTRLAAGSFLFARGDAFLATGGFSLKVYASEEIWMSRALKRWGAARGLEFLILDDPPVVTSARKAEWYSGGALLASALLLLLFPVIVRWRALCWLWYRRPATTDVGRSAPSVRQFPDTRCEPQEGP